jgi:quercetin dioxygenase-like cupin family protein
VLWFLGFLVTVKASSETTGGQVAVIEHHAPRGAGSPLHVHHREDEWFYVSEGELTFWVGGEVIAAPAGSFVYGPRSVPHTFTVSSEEARFLRVTEPAASRGSYGRSPIPPSGSPSRRLPRNRPTWHGSHRQRASTASRSLGDPAFPPDQRRVHPSAEGETDNRPAGTTRDRAPPHHGSDARLRSERLRRYTPAVTTSWAGMVSIVSMLLVNSTNSSSMSARGL